MSTTEEKSAPFVRFGLTEETFRALCQVHESLNRQKEHVCSTTEMPFFDWEAAKLAKVFAHFKDDPVLCSIIAAMMNYVNEGVKRNPKPRTPRDTRPHRASSFGMVA